MYLSDIPAEVTIPIGYKSDIAYDPSAATKTALSFELLWTRQVIGVVRRNPHRDREARFIKSLQTAPTKHLSQSKLIKEILAFELLPLSAALVDSSAWYNNMAMRMIIQVSGMGMKNSRHTDVGAQISRIEPKVFQRTGSTIE